MKLNQGFAIQTTVPGLCIFCIDIHLKNFSGIRSVIEVYLFITRHVVCNNRRGFSEQNNAEGMQFIQMVYSNIYTYI